jgi:hypothetical protein
MAKSKLSVESQELLREVLAKYLPENAERLLEQPPEAWLSPLRGRVRDAVGRELAATGFDGNYAPTKRGEMLEALIDFLNRADFAAKPK